MAGLVAVDSEEAVVQTVTALLLWLTALGVLVWFAYRWRTRKVVVFIVGEARSRVWVVVPADLPDAVTYTNLTPFPRLAWWRWVEWLLVCPATVAGIIALQARVEAALSATEARSISWPAATLRSVAGAAVQVMVVAGVTCALYGNADGARGFLFVVAAAAGGVTLTAVAASVYRIGMLGPTSLRRPVYRVWLLFTLSWCIYPLLFLATTEGWGSVGAAGAAAGYGVLDLLAKDALMVALHRLRWRYIEDPAAEWCRLFEDAVVQTEEPAAPPAPSRASGASSPDAGAGALIPPRRTSMPMSPAKAMIVPIAFAFATPEDAPLPSPAPPAADDAQASAPDPAEYPFFATPEEEAALRADPTLATVPGVAPPLPAAATSGRPGYNPALPVHLRLYSDAIARTTRLIVHAQGLRAKEDAELGLPGASDAGGAGVGAPAAPPPTAASSTGSPSIAATSGVAVRMPPSRTSERTLPPQTHGGGSLLSSAGLSVVSRRLPATTLEVTPRRT